MDRSKSGLMAATALSALIALPVSAQDNSVSFLHYWTSGGEAAAVAEVRKAFEAQGGVWIDQAVAGGGGDAHDQVLRSRTLAGDAPGAAIPKASDAIEWARAGYIVDLEAVAAENKWDEILPAAFLPTIKLDGRYIAVPLFVHRFDSMWANAKLLADNGLEMPETWAEFNAAADALLAAGITPLAHGGQSWQDEILFEAVAIGVGGAEFFRKAFVELDQDTLRSDTMLAVFDQFRKLRGYVDANFSGRDWNLASAMVANGEAAFQIMGDWAKGEFSAAGLALGQDILCSGAPRDQPGGYAYVVNSLSFFSKQQNNPAASPGQELLAKVLLEPEVQLAANLAKGSVPAVKGLDLSSYDACAIKAAEYLAAADADGTLVPSVQGGTVNIASVRGAVIDTATAFFNSDMSSAEGVETLADALRDATE
ncbi:glucose/mannose transport system substrate-binding protein [Devosia enhydra]|uniref:Probable sugar-binding periplasmic protein n=1 Tax=Devosia enhydra TaxID=665118 RepID=A0A1K2HY78_9HYPH|nr:ABC transporter substrate-binding protein [Devosia enhydra]SFZ84601.1 glucose/mannose transport system substrate-binding protein [Devosia enhydra]